MYYNNTPLNEEDTELLLRLYPMWNKDAEHREVIWYENAFGFRRNEIDKYTGYEIVTTDFKLDKSKFVRLRDFQKAMKELLK